MPARPTAVGALLAIALVACGSSSSTVACAPVEHPELQGGSHLLGNNEPPVPYTSTPGTSGWHASGRPRTGVFGPSDPLSEPQLVTALEAGQVVAAYDPAAVPSDAVERLEELARGSLRGELTVTPFEGDMGSPVVLNAWATRQPCNRVDTDAVEEFTEQFADEGARSHD